jgi:hypothetical protein
MDHRALSPGECSTLNFSEWPNDAAVCSLSQVLEKDSIPQVLFEFDGVRRDTPPRREPKAPVTTNANALKSVVTGTTQ